MGEEEDERENNREREIIKGKVLLDYCIELYEEEI